MRTNHTTKTLTIKITPNDKGNPPGKLADAELHFTGDSPLAGLKLIGFSIWERRGGNGRNVTFPARSYVVNGDRRSFALLRPIVDTTAQTNVRDLILEAYAQYEEVAEAATASGAGALAMTRRTAVTSIGRAFPGSLPLASNHCDVLRKYSRPAGSGARSIRSDTTGCRLELARSTSRRT